MDNWAQTQCIENSVYRAKSMWKDDKNHKIAHF